MPGGAFQLSPDRVPFLDILSGGRIGPQGSRGFSGAQIEQIRRTVRRTPEVMVKVTGGGRTTSAVAADLAYISQHGDLELETDEGQRVSKPAQKELLKDWHLELTAGQWHVEVVANNGQESPIEFDINVAEGLAPWVDTSLWIGWPAAVVGLFAVHQFLVRRRPRVVIRNSVSHGDRLNHGSR